MSLHTLTRVLIVIGLMAAIGLLTSARLSAEEPPWAQFAIGEALTEGAMVYDPDTDLIIAYGGRDKHVNKTSDASDDIFVLDAGHEGAGWVEVTNQVAGIAGPEAYSTAGVYFPTRKQVVFFAGKGLGDRVVALDTGEGVRGLRWSEPRIAGTVSGRRSHTAVYVPEMDAMVAFGGTIGNTKLAAESLDDVVVIASNGPGFLRKVVNVPDGPSGRYDHAAIYDPVHQMMIIYGGQLTGKGPVFSDLWGLDLREPLTPRWVDLGAAVTGDGPGARSAHTAVYDPQRQQMVVFGGKGATAKEVWALNLANGLDSLTWVKTVAADAPGAPGSVSDHTAVWVGAHDCMMVYGGTSKGVEVGSTWMYHPIDSAGHNWRPDPVSGCDVFDPESVCGARLAARVYLDVRCDGVYTAGYDHLLTGATVEVTVPAQARTESALTDARGSAYFSGLDVPAGQPLSVNVTHPQAGRVCGYGGGTLAVPSGRFGLGNFAALSVGLSPAP